MDLCMDLCMDSCMNLCMNMHDPDPFMDTCMDGIYV